MRRLLLAIPFLVTAAGSLAQPCTPDTSINNVGMYPNTFPHATAGVQYAQVFQFKFPTDTTFGGFTVTIDSVEITSVAGLPDGFTYACNKPDCVYNGGDNGCVLVSGKTNTADTHKVLINLTAYGVFGGQTIPAPYSDTVTFIVDPAPAGLGKQSKTNWGFSVNQNYPNPFRNSTEISFALPQAQAVTFKVHDLLGKEVSIRILNGLKGENKITVDRTGMTAGMYFYSVQYGNQVITKRMSVKN